MPQETDEKDELNEGSEICTNVSKHTTAAAAAAAAIITASPSLGNLMDTVEVNFIIKIIII